MAPEVVRLELTGPEVSHTWGSASAMLSRTFMILGGVFAKPRLLE